jgi:riboflavin kinase/FMN adenylyltransferase
MKIHRDLTQNQNFTNCILTIGSFDGLHIGHKELLRKVTALAELYQCPSVVLTFDPHPREIIYPRDKSLRLITTIDEKVRLFEGTGIDHLVILPFTVEFSQLLPQEYIEKFIIGQFDPNVVVVGYDHRYGLNRQGGVDMMSSYGNEFGFDVIKVDKQTCDNIDVSSTKIREAVSEGNIALANRLLGYPYMLSGSVVHGKKVGNKIGYPTANIELRDTRKLVPPDGIYAVYAFVEEQKFKGMLYIGSRPSVESNGDRSIEVHLFDFNGYIYGEIIVLELIDYIRADARFDSITELKIALRSDQVKVNRSLSQFESSEL